MPPPKLVLAVAVAVAVADSAVLLVFRVLAVR
jgi:hypothetical protein